MYLFVKQSYRKVGKIAADLKSYLRGHKDTVGEKSSIRTICSPTPVGLNSLAREVMVATSNH